MQNADLILSRRKNKVSCNNAMQLTLSNVFLGSMTLCLEACSSAVIQKANCFFETVTYDLRVHSKTEDRESAQLSEWGS
jgi:hypothetical protein